MRAQLVIGRIQLQLRDSIEKEELIKTLRMKVNSVVTF